MATYKEKVGTSVVNYAGNYPGAVEGELWYDSTNKDFKYLYPFSQTAFEGIHWNSIIGWFLTFIILFFLCKYKFKINTYLKI